MNSSPAFLGNHILVRPGRHNGVKISHTKYKNRVGRRTRHTFSPGAGEKV